MGGMVAQELALLLLQQGRLISLGLAVTCRGLKPLGGLLGPLIKPQVRRLLNPWHACKGVHVWARGPGCDLQGAEAAGGTAGPSD
jgi:hypothetical protein